MQSGTARASPMSPPPPPSAGGPKRKRSLSDEGALGGPPPQAKHAKPPGTHLQINYLVRQNPDDLPLLTAEDSLPTVISLITNYDGVLQRHESMAGNMGARPLGPILIARFERLFDGPPRVLKTHGRDGNTVTWLDVVEFARNKPDQFNLDQTRDGARVCQFWLKQCRVEISEEDYVIIASGIPQKMIPPQPIEEDEFKELGTLEILEKNIQQVIQMADHVSARARQLNHRLKNRKSAIISRRAQEGSGSGVSASSVLSEGPLYPPSVANGSSGFVAVNSVQGTTSGSPTTDSQSGSRFGSSSKATIPPAIHEELLNLFKTTAQLNQEQASKDLRTSSGSSLNRSSSSTARPKHRNSSPGSLDTADYAAEILVKAANGTISAPETPGSLGATAKSSPLPDKDDAGPYKAEMLTRLENLNRGDPIFPPCDRCRRLQIDCRKNLTACMGCTKKHAKCSWKNVKQDELLEAMETSNNDSDAGQNASTEQGLVSSPHEAQAQEDVGRLAREANVAEARGQSQSMGEEAGTLSSDAHSLVRPDPLANIPVFRQPGLGDASHSHSEAANSTAMSTHAVGA